MGEAVNAIVLPAFWLGVPSRAFPAFRLVHVACASRTNQRSLGVKVRGDKSGHSEK